ncbi:sigma-70 family RNA polymerase sigma factor [bacterium]|nr:sigma-70 family RNA polymerase sigma factor [bacterium]
MDAQDHDLLARFRNHRDDAAFRQLVERHIGMVFAVSQRVTGSREQAEEIAQTTFARLADRSEEITRETVLAGWLYQTARRLALSAVRSDTRRRQREQIAAAMNFNEPGPDTVAEHLESAMDQLKPEDRDALVLRFFEDRNLRDVGQELGLSEDAARMRVNRALEKLRGIFGKLGIAGSIAWLTTTLPTSASATVPVGLAASITTAVLSGTAIGTTASITHGASTTMNILNLKTGAAVLAAAAITGTSTYLVKDHEADHVKSELQAANESRSQLMTDKDQAAAAIKLRDDQIEQLKNEVADLPRLRGQLDSADRTIAQLTVVKEQYDQLTRMLKEGALKPPSNFASILEQTEGLANVREWHAKERYAQLLAQALATAADQDGGMFPSSIEAAKAFMGDKFYGGARVLGILVRADDFEVSYKGKLSDIKEPEKTMLLREKEPVRYFNKMPSRTCLFADMSTDVVPVGELSAAAADK